MKERVYLLLVSVFIFWSMTTLFTGISIRQGVIGYLTIGGMFGFLMLFVPRVIRFLTFKSNLITETLFSIILTALLFYLLQFISPLILFQDGSFKGVTSTFLIFKDLPLDKNSLIAVFSIFCATINTAMMNLTK